MSESFSLWTLFVSSFLAATLLPGGSEVVLYAVLKNHPSTWWTALFIATVGNTVGGLTSYLIGRLVPARREGKAVELARRYGVPTLLFSWAPVIGDALCVAAGWLRLNLIVVTVFIATGKFARYLAIAWIAA